MDSESLDRCIQTALASLYPPFQVTSPTVLCQVLSVVERCYRGDGLRYLINFLLPAKNFLQNLQQDACVQYCGLLFRHEGWPLCVHEKVVVQLCPLDQRLLHPSDFYLLVSTAVTPPPPRSHGASCRGGASVTPRLLLCSVSAGSHHVEQQEVSQLALRSVFSMAWLDSINRERERRGAPRLERCLLSAHGDVFRVPWEDLVYPQFINRPRPAAKEDKEPSAEDGDVLINTSNNLCRDTNSSGQDRKLLPPLTKTDQSAVSSDGEDSEGEYVELTELPRFSPQKGSLTQSISLQHRARTTTNTPVTHTTTTYTPVTHTTTTYTPVTHTTTTYTPVTHSTTTYTPVTHSTTTYTPVTHSTTTYTPVTHSTTTYTPVTHFTTTYTPDATHTDTITHTPATTHTHTPATIHTDTAHTPATIYSTATYTDTTAHINTTHPTPAAATDTPHPTHTHSAATTHPCGTAHFSQPGVEVHSRLSEENRNQNQNSCEVVVLTTIYCQQEPTEGTEPDRSQNQNPEPETRTKQREQEEIERTNKAVESEGEEEVKDEEQCRKNQDEGEEMEEEEGSEDEGAEEVELEEEVQVIIMQQSVERKEEVMEEEERGGERGGAHIEKDCFTENSTQHKHTEDSFPGSNTTDTHLENSSSEESSVPPSLSEESSVRPSLSEESSVRPSLSEESSVRPSLSEESSVRPSLSEESSVRPSLSEESSVPPSLSEESGIRHVLSEGSSTHHRESKSPRCVATPAVEEPKQSDSGLENLEEKKQEVAGGAAALHTEALSNDRPPAQSEFSVSAGSSPTEPEQPVSAPTVPVPSFQSRFYSVLLRSGAVCLPGSTDRAGRALLTVSTCSSVWSNPDCDSAELLRLLLYYTSTLRKQTRASGLTVLMDARRAAPATAMFSALWSLQEDSPGSIHTVLILANKDSTLRLDKPAATQVEVVNSLKSLQKHVELHQLPAQFGGSFSFSQSIWISFRWRVEQLTNQCKDVIDLLQKTINILQATPLPAAAQDAELLLSRYRAMMCSILEDSRLVQLQQEGGASLSRLRREEGGVGATEEQRAVVEAVTSLYDQVDELLHRLVTLSNSRTQELNFISDFRSLEQGFNQVRSWLQDIGEVRLKTLDEPEDSLELLTKKQQDFKEFYTTAYDHCKRGEELLSRLDRWEDVTSADLHVYEVQVHSFWAQLQDFSQRVNSTGQNMDRAVQLYRFLDQAYGWALEGMRHLAGISMDECTLPDKCQAVIGCLEDYHRQHPPIPDSRFQEMKAAAGELRGERGLRQWSFAWSKCQETKKMFDRKMEAALRTRDSAHRRGSDSALSWSSASSRKSLLGLWGVRETSSSSSCPPEEDTDTSSPLRNSASLFPVTSTPPRNSAPLLPLTSSPRNSTSPPTPRHTPLLQRLFRSSSSSEESSDRAEVCSSSPSLPRLDSSSSILSTCRRHQLRKTQSFDCPSTPESSRYGPCPRALSEPVRRGNTGVFIRGLEVSSTEASDHTLCPRMAAHSWAGTGPCSPPGTPRTLGTPADPRPRGSKLRHIVEEMVTTEREYVRSLRYIIHHYFPEMDRADLPQDLRGKRSVVFGNLEKLLDFHSQFFLRELEACWKHPLRVPHCFLRHQEQFSLYALYSKNKPKSDALLANHGLSFFRRKQLELADKMDLSSYLLKPIQRMSKYALLLSDLMKEVGVAQEAELIALQAATNMVKFQLRHGNDLLAMDAIRDCDVNLKEQGQLIRQDEFTVCSGRRKCQRHIFLFEELVLFSKPKKMEGGLDVFIYKHSFKTADVGLTESTGDSGLRFEIWFRRRTSKNQTFILQASSADVKHAWTSDIARILWTQATRNKEMRLKEMVSMGVGNKPFLDIQPSDAAISDRAVHYIMKSRGARTRASIAVSVFDHSHPFKRGAVTSDSTVSGPSSSSLLGPLNLHMYSQTLPSPPAAQSSFTTSCIEEDEQEHETSSQPSMTTESSGSSSRCLSGSTGSDSGCVSSNLQEALQEEPRPHSQNSASCSSSSKQRISSQYLSPKAAAVISPATVV